MKSKQLITLTITIVLSCCIFFFIAKKAAVASYTHDESYSYNMYVHQPFMDIISLKDSYTNNHLLNTLLTKWSEKIFGTSEWALRLPNLLLLILSFGYVYLLLKRQNKFFALGIFLVIFCNAALLDIYGLSRGYGISIGFMLMAIYHLIESFYSSPKLHLILFNLASLLAILGNFTMLDFYLSALIVFNGVCFYEERLMRKRKFQIIKANKVNLFMLLPMVIILYEPVRRVITYNHFDFGGNNGFLRDTFQAIEDTMLVNTGIHYSLSYTFIKLIMMISIVAPMIILIYYSINEQYSFFKNNKELVIVNGTLVLIFTIVIAQHLLLNTDYVVGRFALFLFPLFVLNLGFLLSSILKYKAKVPVVVFSISVGACSVYNLYTNANFYECAAWGYDSETKHAMQVFDEWHQQNDPENLNVKMGINWIFEPSINFYRTINKLNYLQPVDRKEITPDCDYYYIFNEDLENLKLGDYEVVFSSERTKTILIKNKF